MPTRPASPLWNSLILDRGAALSLQDQIVAHFRASVLAGHLKAGTRVPSSRTLAADTGVARITAVQAYDRLVAEGYLTARRGAGMFIAETVPDEHLRPVSVGIRNDRAERRPRVVAENPRSPLVPTRPREIIPLFVGIPALDAFPWVDWARISARIHRERPTAALSYGDPRGEPDLREAIAQHLSAARGIACEPDQIIVVAGSQQGIDLAARALAEPGDAVWFEEPGYPMGRSAFEAALLRTVPVPVDAEGIDVAKGMQLAPHARLALVAPSHQHPLGVTMSLRRRLALLDWAESAGAWIIEDDYDGEFRYAGRPLAPLCTLDRAERVIYLGTFSKVMAPGLRLGYLMVPPGLAAHFASLKAISDRHAPGLTQHVLARFMKEGRFAAHIRRMRMLYAGRRLALLDALEREAIAFLDARATPPAGLHLAAILRVDGDDVVASKKALTQRVHAAPLSTYYAGSDPVRGFVLGFAGTPEEQMRPAIRRLVAAITSP